MNRRSFLANLVGYVVAASLACRLELVEPEEQPPIKTSQYGGIRWFLEQWENHKELPNSKLVMLRYGKVVWYEPET